MSYETVNYDDVEPVANGMHFLRDPLGCEQLGVTVVDLDGDWTGKEHDHADDGQEEVYVLIEGEATIEVEDEAIELSPGDAVRVDPDATRTLSTDTGGRLVIAGAS